MLNDYDYFDTTETVIFRDDEYYYQYDYYQCLAQIKVGQCLALGGKADLIVDVTSISDIGVFDFWVINGQWKGTWTHSTVLVHYTKNEIPDVKITKFHITDCSRYDMETNYNETLREMYA